MYHHLLNMGHCSLSILNLTDSNISHHKDKELMNLDRLNRLQPNSHNDSNLDTTLEIVHKTQVNAIKVSLGNY